MKYVFLQICACRHTDTASCSRYCLENNTVFPEAFVLGDGKKVYKLKSLVKSSLPVFCVSLKEKGEKQNEHPNFHKMKKEKYTKHK